MVKPNENISKYLNAANFSAYVLPGPVIFPVGKVDESGSQQFLKVESLSRDVITNLALLSFSRMEPDGLVSLFEPGGEVRDSVLKTVKGVMNDLPGSDILKAELMAALPTDGSQDEVGVILDHIQLSFYTQGPLKSMPEGSSNDNATIIRKFLQQSIRSPRSPNDSWDIVKQYGHGGKQVVPEGVNNDAFSSGQNMRYGDIEKVQLSNLVSSLGVEGITRNGLRQTLVERDAQGNEKTIHTLFGMGAASNRNAKAAEAVLESLPMDTYLQGLVAEEGAGFLVQYGAADEANIHNIVKNQIENNPNAIEVKNVSLYSQDANKSPFQKSFYQNRSHSYKDEMIGEVSILIAGMEDSDPNKLHYMQLLNDAKGQALGIAMSAFIRTQITGQSLGLFCKSGKDRTGCEATLVQAIASCYYKVKDFNLRSPDHMKLLADTFRDMAQSGVRNFVSGLNTPGAGVLEWAEVMPKAFMEIYKKTPEGSMFLDEVTYAAKIGKNNKGWKPEYSADLEKKQGKLSSSDPKSTALTQAISAMNTTREQLMASEKKNQFELSKIEITDAIERDDQKKLGTLRSGFQTQYNELASQIEESDYNVSPSVSRACQRLTVLLHVCEQGQRNEYTHLHAHKEFHAFNPERNFLLKSQGENKAQWENSKNLWTQYLNNSSGGRSPSVKSGPHTPRGQ